jgi:CelD/BcsL family acetyltransferase involved in cellulose biosynthesis
MAPERFRGRREKKGPPGGPPREKRDSRMISFEIIEDTDKMESYFSQWDRLFDSGAYEASLSLEWTRALQETHLDGTRFFLLVLRDSTEILGMVPLCIRTIRKQGLSLSTLYPLSEYFNTHSDLLLKNPSEKVTNAFLKAIFSVRYKWDVFRINRFVETSPVLGIIECNLKNDFDCNYVIRREEPSFFIPLANSYNDYLEKKNSHFRNNLKRVSRKMHSLGNVAFLSNRDFQDFAEAYGLVLSIEEKSWKHKNGTAMTSTEKQRAFYRTLCKGAFDKGRLRLSILTLNNEPIAFEMGLLKDNKYYSVHGSYDEKFKKENPGTMLLAKFIEDLIHDGIKEFDFFGEPFEWERNWTDQFRWHTSLAIYNNTLKAKLLFLYHAARKKLEHGEQDRLVLRNPRDIKPEPGH